MDHQCDVCARFTNWAVVAAVADAASITRYANNLCWVVANGAYSAGRLCRASPSHRRAAEDAKGSCRNMASERSGRLDSVKCYKVNRRRFYTATGRWQPLVGRRLLLPSHLADTG